jgi:hypothetical protein
MYTTVRRGVAVHACGSCDARQRMRRGRLEVRCTRTRRAIGREPRKHSGSLSIVQSSPAAIGAVGCGHSSARDSSQAAASASSNNRLAVCFTFIVRQPSAAAREGSTSLYCLGSRRTDGGWRASTAKDRRHVGARRLPPAHRDRFAGCAQCRIDERPAAPLQRTAAHGSTRIWCPGTSRGARGRRSCRCRLRRSKRRSRCHGSGLDVRGPHRHACRARTGCARSHDWSSIVISRPRPASLVTATRD